MSRGGEKVPFIFSKTRIIPCQLLWIMFVNIDVNDSEILRNLDQEFVLRLLDNQAVRQRCDPLPFWECIVLPANSASASEDSAAALAALEHSSAVGGRVSWIRQRTRSSSCESRKTNTILFLSRRNADFATDDLSWNGFYPNLSNTSKFLKMSMKSLHLDTLTQVKQIYKY